MTLLRLSLLLAVAGVALVLTGVLVGPPGFTGIEGAIFTRAAGVPAHNGAFIEWGEDSLLGPGDGNLWLGAGVALLLVALATVIAHSRGVRIVRATASS
jgi:hypothetical protein